MTPPRPIPAHEAETRRALELDTLNAILPMDRRDQLANLLTDADVATLAHLARQGLGANSLRALTSDLAYLEAWALAASGGPLPWPVSEALVLKFVAHHLWDAAEQESNPGHGMPQNVADALRRTGTLRQAGPHAPSTVKRRLASWGTLHRWRGLDGPFAQPSLRAALRLAVRAADRPPQRKSRRAVTRDILDRLLATCASDSLADRRDRALLLVAFASGGRRRSEVAALRVEHLSEHPATARGDTDPPGPPYPCLGWRLGRTKTSNAGDANEVLLVGPPVEALRDWLEGGDIVKGTVFRAIDRWDGVSDRPLTPQSITLIVKRRCILAGLDPREYAAHGLRAGFLTEAAHQGIALQDAMQQSQHRSVQQAVRYYNDANRSQSRAVKLGL